MDSFVTALLTEVFFVDALGTSAGIFVLGVRGVVGVSDTTGICEPLTLLVV